MAYRRVLLKLSGEVFGGGAVGALLVGAGVPDDHGTGAEAARDRYGFADFKLKGAPFLNIFGLLFMAAVLLLIMFGDDPKAAKAVYIGGPVLAALMVGGWFLVRGRINSEAFDDEASRMS